MRKPKTTIRWDKAVLLIVFLIPATSLIAFAQDADKLILAKIESLMGSQALVAAPGDSKPYADYKAQLLNSLSTAKAAIQEGNPYFGLHMLQSPFLFVTRQEYLSKSDLRGKGFEAFEKEWKAVGKRLTKKKKLLDDSMSGAELPEAVEAMVIVARLKSGTYYTASIGFAEIDVYGMAIPYLGVCEAYLDFGLFCSELSLTPLASKINPAKLKSHLEGLEKEILDLYRQPGATNMQNLFNQANASLETAQGLLDENALSGALMEYLDSSFQSGVIACWGSKVESLDNLKALTEEMGTRFDGSGTDFSLGLLYLARARMHVDVASGNSEDRLNLVSAAAILTKVLPAYFEIIKEGEQ